MVTGGRISVSGHSGHTAVLYSEDLLFSFGKAKRLEKMLLRDRCEAEGVAFVWGGLGALCMALEFS